MMRRTTRRQRALLGCGLAVLVWQGAVPITLRAATPTVAVPDAVDAAAVTQVVTASGSGGGIWVAVATTARVVPLVPASPPRQRVGVPITRDEAPTDDSVLTADDGSGQEGEGSGK